MTPTDIITTKSGLRFLSVCSGIEAASVAWGPLGWQAVGFSEVEPFPCAVLAHHYPDVPNHGSLTEWENWIDDVPDFDVLAGGTPCQGFSVAGRRGGLDDPRSQLAFDFLGIARSRQPKWVFWENVPGVLSSGGGRDFGAFLGELGKCGYGFAYRVLDAQYFGLAQRRKRVFVVGYLGDWRPAAAVLLEPESLRGDSPPSRETGEGTAADVVPSLTGSGRGVERTGESRGQAPVVAQPLRAGRQYSDMGDGQANVIAHALRAEGHDASEDGTGRGVPLVADRGGLPDVSHCVTARDHKGSNPATNTGPPLIPMRGFFDAPAGTLKANNGGGGFGSDPSETFVPVAVNLRGREGGAMPELDDVASLRAADGGSSRSYVFQERAVSENLENGPQGKGYQEELAYTLEARNKTQNVVGPLAVRRLTPTECARLQGFPDNYLDITYRGKPAADGPKYKALGNSWAVPVVRWIGERVAASQGRLFT